MAKTSTFAEATKRNVLEFARYKDFDRSLVQLGRRGGKYQKAADRIDSVLGKASRGESNPFHGLKVTKHGENRVDKCVKYDLGDGIRLITIQDSGVVLFCFAGTHTECDEWLDRNRGSTLIRDSKGQIKLNPLNIVKEGFAGFREPLKPITGKLYELIKPDYYFDKLVDSLPRSVVREIEGLEAWASDEDLLAIAERIDDQEVSDAFLDVFALLKKDEIEKAVERIRLFMGESQPIAMLTKEEIAALAESDQIRKISPNDPNYPEVLRHFARHGSYMDWMLYLHPDQQDIVDRTFSGPAKLVGVSGSGKTCVIVKRAIRLARDNPDEKVLVLTLNRQLARLIEDMVEAAAVEEIASRVLVLPLFRLCQELLHRFEPKNDRLYDDITWKSHEHIDEIWREFYRCELNNNDAAVLLPLHDSLISRGIDAEEYIREEFDWIRSAFPPDRRTDYLHAERVGRSYPLDKRFRAIILEGLEAWELKMKHIGVTDYLGLSTALNRHLDKLHEEYRFVLIDESQDFGTIEFRLVRRLTMEGQDSLFLCGDAAQQVQTKHGSLRDAGINIPSARSIRLTKNYRNSREILSAAYEVLVNNLSEEMLDSPDFDVLDPEHGNFSSSAPLILEADSLEEEIAYAREFVEDVVENKGEQKCCIALCGYSLYQIQEFGKRIGVPVLDGNIVVGKEDLYLSDLEHTKGFEFDAMLILNCKHGVIPNPGVPEKEQYRDLARFYVAMTRAKNHLVLSFSSTQSPYLVGVDEYFLSERWENYIDRERLRIVGVPLTIDEIRADHEQIEHVPDLLDMSGTEFLYTRHAIGLSSLLIDKLRRLIAGSKTRGAGGKQTPIGWRSIRAAAHDIEVYPGSRQVFGAEGLRQFRKLVEKISEIDETSEQSPACPNWRPTKKR